jgi:hypothetical protein
MDASASCRRQDTPASDEQEAPESYSRHAPFGLAMRALTVRKCTRLLVVRSERPGSVSVTPASTRREKRVIRLRDCLLLVASSRIRDRTQDFSFAAIPGVLVDDGASRATGTKGPAVEVHRRRNILASGWSGPSPAIPPISMFVGKD